MADKNLKHLPFCEDACLSLHPASKATPDDHQMSAIVRNSRPAPVPPMPRMVTAWDRRYLNSNVIFVERASQKRTVVSSVKTTAPLGYACWNNMFLLLTCASLLLGCGTERGKLEIVPEDSAPLTIKPVIVATSRAPTKGPPYYGNQRSYTTHFSLMEISVPPDRKVGTAPFPEGNIVDPKRHFLVASHQRLEGEQGFVRAIDKLSTSRRTGNGQGSVLVHGFNTNLAEAVTKTAQFTYDLGQSGVTVLYSWPSAAKVTKYLTDRESVLFARDSLAQTLSATSRSSLSSYIVAGHSMGTFLVMETLRSMVLAKDYRTLRKISAVVLISADLDIDVFRKQAKVVLSAGLPIFVVVSGGDRALSLSARLRGRDKRVGSTRSIEELGNIDVTIVDLSKIEDGGSIGHSKAAESEIFLSYINGLNNQGINVFQEHAQPGLAQTGVLLLKKGPVASIVEPIVSIVE